MSVTNDAKKFYSDSFGIGLVTGGPVCSLFRLGFVNAVCVRLCRRFYGLDFSQNSGARGRLGDRASSCWKNLQQSQNLSKFKRMNNMRWFASVEIK